MNTKKRPILAPKPPGSVSDTPPPGFQLIDLVIRIVLAPLFLPLRISEAVRSYLAAHIARSEIAELQSLNRRLKTRELQLLVEVQRRQDELEKLSDRFQRLRRTNQQLEEMALLREGPRGGAAQAGEGGDAAGLGPSSAAAAAAAAVLSWPYSATQVSRTLLLSLGAVLGALYLAYRIEPAAIRGLDKKFLAAVVGPSLFVWMWALTGRSKRPSSAQEALSKGVAGMLLGQALLWLCCGYLLSRMLARPEDVALTALQDIGAIVEGAAGAVGAPGPAAGSVMGARGDGPGPGAGTVTGRAEL